MTTNQIKTITEKVETYLREQRLRDALTLLKNTSEGALLFELTDELKQIEQTYAYMLRYLTAGAEDPQRDNMLGDLIARTYRLNDRLALTLLEKETPTLYYNIRRFDKKQSGSASLSRSITAWREAFRLSSSLSALYAEASQRDNGARTTFETAEKNLFNSIWTTFELNRNDRQDLTTIINSHETPMVSAIRFTSALGLAACEFADSGIIEALCDIYSQNSEKEDEKSQNLAAVALISIIIVLYKFSSRIFTSSTLTRIQALQDSTTWNRDVRLAFMELVRARDTERINRTMREEIIPGMMAIKPEIEKKLRDISPDDIIEEGFADNPQWEELLANSEIGKKLKEFNELQMDGSDIFMGTFSHLKNFPFFNEVVGWFTKLTDDNPQVEEMLKKNPELSQLVSLISDLPFLCDNDKFSMLFSIGIIPQSQLQMMIGQLTDNSDHLNDIKSHYNGITDADNRRILIRNHIHNLYRFVNLFRRKGEFYNIFNHDINLVDVPLLKNALLDADLLKLIAEFYFKHKYYSDSLTVFKALEDLGEFDATLYQKIGFAYEKTGNFTEALRYYEQADLLDSSSRWVKTHLVTTYRHLDRIPEALDVLKILNESYPEDVELAKMTGYTYIAADNYREALKHFYKAEFIDDSDRQIVRALAWSLFMVRDFEKAESYYNKLLMMNPNEEDYLNMGHVALALSKFKEAINYYKMFIFAVGNDKEKFFQALDNDRQHLLRVGLKNNVIRLIADAMLYELNN